MNTTATITGKDIEVGMSIIPAGRKRPVEVLTIDPTHPATGLRVAGIYGKGFEAICIYETERVTLAL